MIVDGETKSGFKFSVDTRRVTDFRYVRVLSKLADEKTTDTDKVLHSIEAIEFLLGKYGVDKLCEHIAESNDGYASSGDVIAQALEINSIVANASNEVKN